VQKTVEPLEMPFEGLIHVGLRNCIRWAWDSHRKGQFWGFSRPLKSIVSLFCIGCSKMDHSVLNNAMRVRLMQPTATQLVGCHITLSPVKNTPPPCYAIFYQNSLTISL